MASTEIAVSGLAALRAQFLALPKKIQKRALDKAFAAGARLVAADAKRRAPVKTGAIKRNIVAKKGAKKYQMGADSRYIVGVRHGRTNTNAMTVSGRKRKVTSYDKRGQDPFYFRFQELGFTAVGRRKAASKSEDRLRKAGRRSYGTHVPGKKFLEDALTSTAYAATIKIRDVLAYEIAKLQ